jgi:hypothetical protein
LSYSFLQKEWNGNQLPVKDTQDIVDFFDQTWKSGNVKEVVSKTLGNTEFWEQDLNQIEGLTRSYRICTPTNRNQRNYRRFHQLQSKIFVKF